MVHETGYPKKLGLLQHQCIASPRELPMCSRAGCGVCGEFATLKTTLTIQDDLLQNRPVVSKWKRLKDGA